MIKPKKKKKTTKHRNRINPAGVLKHKPPGAGEIGGRMRTNTINDINNADHRTAPASVFGFINSEQATVRGCPRAVFNVLLVVL